MAVLTAPFDTSADWIMSGTWNITTLEALSANIGALAVSNVDDGVMLVTFTTSSDGNACTAFYEYGTGLTTYVAGAKVLTDADTPLELKSGLGSTTLQSYVYINGGQRFKVATKTADYSLDATGDFCVAYTTLAAARTATLPLLSSVQTGQAYMVVDATTGTHADTNNITVKEHATDGAATINTINTANGRWYGAKLNGEWRTLYAA